MIRRLSCFALIAVLALSGCRSNPTPETALSEEADRGTRELPPEAQDSAVTRGAKWTALVPGNVVWWPWKVIGRAGRGAVDGSAAGFDHGMPIYGVVFLPINAVAGFLTGAVEGAAMGPGIITPDHDYGREMSKPLRLPITVWWYAD
jgi:hypothetical protein